MNPIIILISPQMGENIGATARAMKNFGLSDLRIVSPRDGWPNPKADSMSVGAIDIIENAKIYTRLPEAIEDIEFLYATTATTRAMNKNYILANELGMSYPFEQKVGIMFGRENSGLTNDEIAYANVILSIGTEKEFSSLNIAHAVAIIAHEIWHLKNPEKNHEQNSQNLATRGEIEYFFESLLGILQEHNFFKIPEKQPNMSQNIRNIFSRIDKLSKNELQTLHGIIKTLTKHKL